MSAKGSIPPPPPSPALSASQLARLAELGEERTADLGEVLYQVGDRSYPFIAILEGEAAILDAAGNEIVRHGASGFLGELNLLSGQTVFVNAVVTRPMRYIAVEREVMRGLLYEDGGCRVAHAQAGAAQPRSLLGGTLGAECLLHAGADGVGTVRGPAAHP